MKKTVILFILATIVISCKQKPKEDVEKANHVEIPATGQKVKTDSTQDFNFEEIPYTKADLGVFPFFTLPNGLKEMNKPLQKKFDICFFPVEGVMKAFEGKLYKANITNEEGIQFSQHYFEKSMDDYLTSIGAVKIFSGTITQDEFERYYKKDPNKGDEGDIGYADEQINVYAIRSKTQGNILVQYSSTNAGAKLNILQQKLLTQTISKITADDIIQDLVQTGKSILYINFDTDKSDITADGKEVVSQIAEALHKDKNLKISIEGHTDNTGDATHNKKLSADRANSVMEALVSQNILKTRLSAKGFGAERPLAANDSEESKAKNRRVELVKIN
ncbi:OmpA family protein [Chryseobacterium sp. SSA4.19]|uniref:OmpA family protein n=1 Tax=Chryseobacterium sp. SSA4.19 TaxID=2919915 RepID=UPI001F4E1697|nr:OmpA family protein [Chryseobacterium sp. SSA4.19]MCJ8155716.1 OmpA family protein [Chryseobacterium sp. SSA4.19]